MTRLTDLSGHDATVDITASSPEQHPYVSSDDQMTFSLTDDTITLSGYNNDYTLGGNVSITGIGVPWTNTVTGVGYDPTWNNHASTKIKLDGPEADIEINGESLVDMLRNIEQRLNLLKPNEKLESEWAELRELGDAYRKLEAHIQAKMKTWDAISK
jgi:hypothetical protein